MFCVPMHGCSCTSPDLGGREGPGIAMVLGNEIDRGLLGLVVPMVCYTFLLRAADGSGILLPSKGFYIGRILNG